MEIPVKIFATGGTGFVGTYLCQSLLNAGHQLTVLVRSEKKADDLSSEVSMIQGDPMRPGEWQNSVAAHDIIINLAGAPIFVRWTDASKQLIRDSRVLSTRNVVSAIPVHTKPMTLFSTSAVGYYKANLQVELTEQGPVGDGFLAGVTRDWEAEAMKAETKGCRVIITRFGIVLGPGGGALSQMVSTFNKFLGGPLGSGEQWFPWIHIEDLARAYLFLLDRPSITGPVNFCSPNPVQNKDLAKALGKVLGRPCFMRTPAFVLKAALGEFASALLDGHRMVPRKLLDSGFEFKYPALEGALEEILSK